MLKHKAVLTGLAMLVGAGGLASAAIAAPLHVGGGNATILEEGGIAQAQPVAQVWVYDKNRHGKRYRYKQSGYTYYHNGWYYQQPWWTAPLAIPGAVVGGVLGGVAGGAAAVTGTGDPHVSFCMNRYRSYDPESDTFMGNDGMRHPCIGP